MCGIFGGQAKKGKKLNLRKLKILGIYNMERGTDSCGYYYSGNIEKGTGETAKFLTFIDRNEIKKGELDCEVFMGHTRKSTSGANTPENAHPHQIGNYVQTHNGVIKNIWELMGKYGMDHSKVHVDSIGLGMLIKKLGFRILNEYTGFAALTMVYEDDPESLYLYHGASKDKKDSKVWEERPLFYIQTSEGLYYSSMPESLRFISEGKYKIQELPHNIVYKIVDGEITDFRYRVERENNNIVHTHYYGGNTTLFDSCCTTVKPLPASSTLVHNLLENVKKNIGLQEDYPMDFLTQDIYYRKGRFFRKENILLHGKYDLDRNAKIILEGIISDRPTLTYYFIRGVMLQSEAAYKKVLKDKPEISIDLQSNFAYQISHYSRYPVSCLEEEGTGVSEEFRELWYKEGKRYNTSFTPKFSKRVYQLTNGILRKIKKSDDEKLIEFSIDKDSKKNVLDGQLINNVERIVNKVLYWSRQLLKKEALLEIPEYFLMFLDFYNVSCHKTIMVTEAQIEQETTATLNDLFKTKQTFVEYLRQYFDETFITGRNIKDCFRDFDIDECLAFENRYTVIRFDIDDEAPVEDAVIIDNYPFIQDVVKNDMAEAGTNYAVNETNESEGDSIEEGYHTKTLAEIMQEKNDEFEEQVQIEIEQSKQYFIKLIDQLKELSIIADELQAFDKIDACQDMAFNTYNIITKGKNDITSVCKEHEGYKEILDTVTEIK